MLTSADIRKKFLEFFERNGHTVVKSSSLIPDDPSVLLTTAGMQQFKKYYTGELDAMKDFGTRSTATCQKSFRTSDIDEVGDERHLTFFEMLGNFSFGGYFKKEAITYAYDFLTKEMGLAISYVTIFEGKDDIGVPKDEESRVIWQGLGIPDSKIIEQGMEDVFWGPTGSEGPCGPTTEIYCKNGAGQDIEVWNIVFNQFFFPASREDLESGASGKKLEPLKTPGVDTGMGLERLVMCAQQTSNIFETDLFKKPFGAFMAAPSGVDAKSGRVFADHVRAAMFLIADGVRPSNKGTGYVLRRLMRRGIMHARQLTGENETGGNSLSAGHIRLALESGINFYGEAYSELQINKGNILEVFEEEREKFVKTLDSGFRELNRLHRAGGHMESGAGGGEYKMFGELSGKDAFRIYQSFGFPREVMKDYCEERGARFDDKGFEEEFRKHQDLSKAGAVAKFGGHGLYMKTGEVTIRDASEVEKVTRLHTATHLLHAGLRAVLGPEVRQDGSDITIERTRFDFRFPRKVTSEELVKVEEWVNQIIQKDLKVEWKETDYESAVKEGALGFFRERYPERVKVYSMFEEKSGEFYSKEFCGGPHVTHTAEVGKFKILKEEAVGAGVRRIRGIIEP